MARHLPNGGGALQGGVLGEVGAICLNRRGACGQSRRRCDQAADSGRCGDAEGARQGPEPGCERQASEERCVREPGQRPHDESHSSERDGEKRPDDTRIELCAGTSCDLHARFLGGRSTLVRPRRGDHVERVRDRDDASGERDVSAFEPVRVARSVPALVVVADRVRPRAEPVAHRCDELCAERRVAAEDSPLVLGGAAALGENLARHLELADVMQKRGPVQEVELVARQSELLADQDGVRTYPLAVAARQPVVDVQRRDQLEQPPSCLTSCGRLGGCLRVGDAFRQVFHRPGTHGDLESGRCFVREDERQLQQGSEWQQPARDAVDGDQHAGREQAERKPPDQEQRQRTGRGRHQLAREVDEEN